MKILRAIFLCVAVIYFLSFAFNVSECSYSSERGFYTSGYDNSSRFWPLLISLICGLCYLGFVGYSYHRPRFVTSPGASTTRKLIPIVFLGALAIFAGSCGIYNTILCLRMLFSASVTAWSYFLVAEFSLLFAWRFLDLTLLSLMIYRGSDRSGQVKIRRGGVARIWFIVATGAAGIGYKATKSIFAMPWWFTHVGHAVIAVLLFCAFTYPWSRRHLRAPNTTPEPTPPAP